MDLGTLIGGPLPELDLEGRVIYLPVRHHSPGCARRVAQVIRARRPQVVLVEGPRDATRWIPALLHPQSACPLAIFTTYVKPGPLRFGAWYPLCDYSPELAALRAAHEVGARARFIDLTFPEMVEAEMVAEPETGARSLLGDGRLQHGAFLQAACRRSGARDPDDLWDHLFETDDRPPEAYFRDVLAYCALSRAGYEEAALRADATLAREAAMAHEIALETEGTVVVVSGGFHAVALPTCAATRPREVVCKPDDAQVLLTRYGFLQLASLNGYASGMPSPEFYQRLWEDEDPLRLLITLGEGATADSIEAVAHARRLADFRGHARPSREDVLDAVRSVFVKGAIDVEGVLPLERVRRALVGSRVGFVPREAGVAPLVADFQHVARALGLAHDDPAAKRLTLDVYRRPKHREVSRFLHRLALLAVPFARRQQGPDFGAGAPERVHEVWTYAWTPRCDAALVERSIYGARVGDACEARLHERMADSTVDAAEAARLLLDVYRAGLHEVAAPALAFVRARIATDAQFLSLTHALLELELLHEGREPLEARDAEGLEALRRAAYERACATLADLGAVGNDATLGALDGMNSITISGRRLGDTLHFERMRDLSEGVDGNPAIRGGACGLLFDGGRLEGGALARRVRGHLLLSAEAGASFLLGLMRTARHVLWDVDEVVAALDERLHEWSEPEFVSVAPSLRQALADLTPRECERVASVVHSGETLHGSPLRGFSEADLRRAMRIEAWLSEEGNR